ncbi:hypothetical protein [Marinobacter xiaoshiensis]|uniref:Histidine kinase-, DNA gyrase B-, and HSP90-like ATPase n=1 Tax=Marinobacter xiaoshiensis TaxID=3073652 RepID=A0ABU2HCS8_9GAMM|nr:hypothetical protein [Marinobacter sp. F60267]MDS1308888.1 hypothetical protein [Marinobacter sp. F60267]
MPFPRMNLHSEQYGRSGNIGENFRKLLGSPALDPLQTVIRESVQNTLDASKLGNPPEVLIRLRHLTDGQLAVLSSKVFSDLPGETTSRERIAQFLDTQAPLVLEICDFGTTGLGGPTRSDQIPIGTTETDFIDFLRNIGSSRDTTHGGGTYGFGKVSLYAMSQCNTILVDTYVHGDSDKTRRLMACHVGKSFGVEQGGFEKRYTGRHWWGTLTSEGDFAEPVINSDATAISEAVGFPKRSASRSGTSIMILGVNIHDDESRTESPTVIGARIMETLLWNFWPRMMQSTPPNRRLKCSVEVDGIPMAVPAPEQFPPLDLFCLAMDKIRSGNEADVAQISCQRPSKALGKLGLQKGLRGKRTPLVGVGSIFPTLSCHIAVMRPVELVVKYFEGEPLPDERLEWAGVFVVDDDDEVEQAFADAEPPAHDNWIPDNLPKGHAKTYVNVALREIKKTAREVAAKSAPYNLPGEAGPSLAKVAGMIGSILDRGLGDGAGARRSKARPSRKTTKRARVSKPTFDRLLDGYGQFAGAVAVFRSDVVQDRDRSGLVVCGDAMFAIEGSNISADSDLPEKPEILEYRFEGPEHLIIGDATGVSVDGNNGTLEIYVAMPEHGAVTLRLDMLRSEDL